MFNPNTAQRVNERYRRLLLGSGWTLPESGAELTLNYDFVAQPNLDPQINPFTGASAGPTLDMTRTTTKKFSDWEGVLRIVLAGEATFTGCRRVENLLTQSNSFNTTWSNTDSVEAQGATDPDGGTTAWTLTDDGGADGPKNSYLRHTFTIALQSSYALSVYAKKDQLNWLFLTAAGLTGAANHAYFDLNNGVVGANVGGNNDFASIEDAGDGWFRCSLGFTTIADGGGDVRIQLADADGDKSVDMDGTSSILLWNSQLENVSGQADTLPSEYVATTTVTAAQTFPIQKNGLPFPTTPLGLLPEEARTNICLQSEDFTTTWSTSNASPVTNQTIAPDGTLTADKFIDDAAAGGPTTVRLKQTITLSDATAYTVSVFAKKDQLDWFEIQLVGTVKVPEQYYDLTNGVVGTANGDVDSSGIESVGNGWYRCWLVWTSDATLVEHRIHVAEADGDKTVDDDGTSSVFVWGAQVEAGAFPTSYIPTTTASVTRNLDIIRTTDVTWFNESAGTWYARASRADGTSGPHIMLASDTTSANRHILSTSTANRSTYSGISSIGDNAALTSASNAFPVGVEKHFAVGYALNDVELYVEGVRTGTGDQSATPPTNISQFDVGHNQSATPGVHLNAHIAELRYYNKNGTRSELEDLSLGLLGP